MQMRFRQTLYSILIAILLFSGGIVVAEEQQAEDASSIIGVPISDIRFENIVHADEQRLEEVVSSYIGKGFSNELYTSLQTELYTLQYFSYFTAVASRTGENNESLAITFTVTELPFITSVQFEGNSFYSDKDLLDKINTQEGGFFSNAVTAADVKLIADDYINKGFINSSVEPSIERDTNENTVEITFLVSEGKQSKIDQISFEGNITYSSGSLKRVLTSKEQSLFNKGDYSELNIQKDRAAIVRYYQERGYIDAAVSDVNISTDESDPTKDLITVTFVISEGEQWRFGGLISEGNTIFTDEQIQESITLSKGEPVNIVTLQSDIARIADLYWNEGYIYNDIVPQQERNERDRILSYTLKITEKQQAYIEQIVIKGNEKTKDYVLSRELTIGVGDVFSKERFIESVQNLYNTGIISTVDYNVLFGSEDGKIVLEFIVEESNKVDLQFGATFGGTSEFPVSGFLSWTDKNFLGRGQDLSISTNIASASQSLDFSFQDGWLANRRWNGGLNFSVSHKKYTDILQDAGGVIFSDSEYYDGTAAPDPYNSYADYLAALDAGESISDEYLMDYDQYKFAVGFNTGYTFHTDAGRIGVNSGLSIGLSQVIYDSDLYRPYNPVVRNNLDTWQFSNKLSLSLNWDGRDLIENTTRGFLFEDSLIYAGGFLGGTSRYIKNTFGASGYLTLFRLSEDELDPRNIVFSARSNISHIFPQFFSYESGFGLEDQPIATQSEKLYIDGMNIVRGIDSPIYNLEFLWDTTLDISVPITKGVLSGEIFASATGYKRSVEDSFDLSIQDFYFSTGAGIKLTIPGFPLGLYLTKVFSFDDTNQIQWQSGELFANPSNPDSGLNLVLAITYNLY